MNTEMHVNYVPVKHGWSWEVFCNGEIIKSEDIFLTKELARRDVTQIMTMVKRKAMHAKMGYTTDLYA